MNCDGVRSGIGRRASEDSGMMEVSLFDEQRADQRGFVAPLSDLHALAGARLPEPVECLPVQIPEDDSWLAPGERAAQVDRACQLYPAVAFDMYVLAVWIQAVDFRLSLWKSFLWTGKLRNSLSDSPEGI